MNTLYLKWSSSYHLFLSNSSQIIKAENRERIGKGWDCKRIGKDSKRIEKGKKKEKWDSSKGIFYPFLSVCYPLFPIRPILWRSILFPNIVLLEYNLGPGVRGQRWLRAWTTGVRSRRAERPSAGDKRRSTHQNLMNPQSGWRIRWVSTGYPPEPYIRQRRI